MKKSSRERTGLGISNGQRIYWIGILLCHDKPFLPTSIIAWFSVRSKHIAQAISEVPILGYWPYNELCCICFYIMESSPEKILPRFGYAMNHDCCLCCIAIF